MIRAKCPTCSRAVEGPALADLPFFPFCSARCRTLDQARWADAEYVVSLPLQADDLSEDAPDAAAD